MTEWQPIETAPKTGRSHFLGHDSGPYLLLSDGGELPVIGFWNGRFWDDGDFQSTMERFTHWMPLPDPPKP